MSTTNTMTPERMAELMHKRRILRSLSPSAAKVLDKLTEGLANIGDAKRIGEPSDAYMPAHVERIGENLYSVAHYFTQNGDRVCDPDMTFLRWGGRWWPVSFEMGGRTYQVGITEIKDGVPTKAARALQADHTKFANTWMRNIKNQQGVM